MNYRIASLFNRSVTFEIENCEAYEHKESLKLYINGQYQFTTSKNVFSVFGLKPDSEYTAELVNEAKKDSGVLHFRTKKESVLLDVRQFGAAGDGVKNDTASIQAAVYACPPEGTVRVPKGVYLLGPVFLKSNITLLLEKDAVLRGLTDRASFPILPGVIRRTDDSDQEINLASWEGNPLTSYASIITGIGVENVNIIGQGTIDANAQNSDWWENVRVKRGAWRPKTIEFNDCRNVKLQGIFVANSPAWTIHPYYCDKVSVIDVSIYNPDDSPNTDGIDPESCSNVQIIGTRISVGDDCVALKSGKIYMGKFHYKRTENVLIRNCRFERGHGAVTIGSEIASGVSGIEVSRCIFSGTDRGLRVKSRRGRGERSQLSGIHFENIRMDNVHMPFTLNMFYFCDPDGHSDYVQNQDYMPVDERTPGVGDISISNIVCTGVDAVFACIYALPESPVTSVLMENLKVSYLPLQDRKDACPIMMDNFPDMNGRSIFVRNADRIEIRNVEITGCADSEPELINVDKQIIENLIYG